MPGQKGRKIGRNKARPSQMRYTQAKRWEANAKKRQKRHVRTMAKHEIKCINRKPAASRDYGRLQELKVLVSQNATG